MSGEERDEPSGEGAGSGGEGPRAHRLQVREDEAGERLDKVLAARGLASRSEAKRWIEAGRVEVEGAAAAPKTKLRAGQSVVARPLPPPPSEAVPQDLPLDVLYEDADLVVVHKPAGLVVHPAPGHPDGTLVNALLHHMRFEDPGGDPMRPGIVHRLDKDTSGVMVVAKSVAAREGLVALFQAHDIERRYEALAVGGLPDAISFETLHGRHPVHRKRFSSKVERGKRAVTHVRVRARLHGASHVDCTLETGRTHQIRVHLADHGAPILGDPLYGKRLRDARLAAAAEAIGRQALHAAVLGFRHPVSGEAMRFEVPPPPEFEAARRLLDEESGR